MTDRDKWKREGTKVDIVNDVYDEIQGAKGKYKNSPEALKALEEIEDVITWWMNTPTVWNEAKEVEKKNG